MLRRMLKSEEIYRIMSFFVLSLFFLLVFSDDSSPLARYWYGSDSSLYMLFGKGLKYGYLPYRDLFDHKGPCFFFLQYIGQMIWEGKTGIFVIQLLNLFACLCISDRIYGLIKPQKKLLESILLTFPLLWVLAGTLQGGNTNEEFSLLFSLIALYRFLLYQKDTEEGVYVHDPKNAFLYGIFFALIAFSRINNSGFLCAVILTVFLMLLKHRQYRNILNNVLMFLAGSATVSIPVILYYSQHGLLKEMLYSSFLFAFQYAVNISFLKKLYLYVFDVNFAYAFICLIPIIVLIASKKTRSSDFLLAVITSLAGFVATFIGYNYSHYFILLVPNLVLTVYLCLKYSDTGRKLLRNRIIAVLLIIMLLTQAYRAVIDFANSMVHSIDINITYRMKGYYKYYTDQSVDIVDHIPEEERNSIWGHGIASRFYMRTGIFPCIRYYDYVDMYFEESLGDVENEIMGLLHSVKPKWIITPIKEASIPKKIDEFICEYYELNYKNEEFNLYRRRSAS